MSDENIVDLTKRRSEEVSNNGSISERVINCAKNKDCGCMYCTYKNGAAQMVYDIVAEDAYMFEEKNKAELSTYDLKDILFKAIYKVKDLEKDMGDSTNEQED